MIRNRLCLLSFLTLILLAPAATTAQESSSAATSKAGAELRESIRLYDEALRRADVATAEQYWAAEYVFINPRGERVSRDARIANLRESRTSFDSLAHAPNDEVIHVYMDGNMAVYTARLTIEGRYGSQAERGEFRALVVWIRRDGRWQQLASQLTPILN
ncbi:MAG TPA: nuclear transport factor 2 family protein [Xanthobacteraceae bacterium]